MNVEYSQWGTESILPVCPSPLPPLSSLSPYDAIITITIITHITHTIVLLLVLISLICSLCHCVAPGRGAAPRPLPRVGGYTPKEKDEIEHEKFIVAQKIIQQDHDEARMRARMVGVFGSLL